MVIVTGTDYILKLPLNRELYSIFSLFYESYDDLSARVTARLYIFISYALHVT
jgi:hypothetical protein